MIYDLETGKRIFWPMGDATRATLFTRLLDFLLNRKTVYCIHIRMEGFK